MKRNGCSRSGRWAFAIVTAVLAAGCMPQTVVTTSTSPPPAKERRPPMLRMLVMGEHLGPNDRRAVEESVAASLKTYGVDAHPGGELFPTPPNDHDAARQAIVTNGYDGALIVSLTAVHDEQCGDLSLCLHDRSGFMTNDRYVTVESMLWDLRGGDDIVWKASTETMNPTDKKDLATNISRTVVPELSRGRFIHAPPPGT